MFKLLGFVLAAMFLLNIILIAILVPIHVVVSDSMAPTYRSGDLLLIDTDTNFPARLGEVVTFTLGNETFTHRIVGVEGNFLVTQGDNNPAADAWMTPFSAVEGRPFVHIPKLGYLLLFLKSPIGWMVLLLAFITWVFVHELRKVTANLRQPQTR